MNKKLLILFSSAALLFNCEKAFSSGFFLIEQSVSAMGAAYAGGAAYAEDASTIWFNPAGMVHICGGQVVAGIHGVIPVADYDDQGSRAVTSFSAAPTSGGIPDGFQPLGSYLNEGDADGRDAGEFALVPQLYLSQQLGNCLWFGVGVTSPYGLVTDYKDQWRGRYHAIRSSLLSININPSFAWKINKCWSIGGGFSAMYVHAKLTNAVDFGLIANAFTGGAASALGLNPQENDGRVEVKGNGWGYGGNGGILYEPCCGTRIGLNFRSEVVQNIVGREKFKDIPEAFLELPDTIPQTAPLVGGFADTNAKTRVVLPMQLSLSAYHAFDRCFAMMADLTWTRWSSIKELRFKFSNPLQSDAVTTLNWNDSLRYSFGIHYRPNNCFIGRLGVAYDETPIPDKEHRTPRIPGEDRFWIATGFGYNFTSCMRLDVGYAHLFVRKAKIDSWHDLVETPENWFKGGLLGGYDSQTDIVSAQLVVNY